MAFEHEHHAEHEAHAHHGPRVLPSVLAAPDAVKTWRMRAGIVAAVFALISALFLLTADGRTHLLRSYLAGYMMCFNIVGGALALLMVQYVSGGKWGLILRRPLEAMTRTWPLLWLGILPIFFFLKKLYLWAAYTTKAETLDAYHKGLITNEEHLDIDFRHVMLNPGAAIFQAAVVLGFFTLLILLLNRWSVQRDADTAAGTVGSFDKWRVRFENVSGPCIVLYVILMTDFVIVFVKSLDIIWASSVYGLQFLVAQGYGVLAIGVLTLMLLSRYEPIKSLFRTTEQHDIGKLMFAFTMLNIYLTFAEFLIIWSGNIPDELTYYLHRIQGGWWTICTLDVVCHWVIPFSLLLSRDIKRSKHKLIWVCLIMIGARMIDLFWLIEPSWNKDGDTLHLAGNFGILAYITVPVTLVAIWAFFYLTELGKRPLLNVNDPHTEELLEPEHAH
jgi:hypothetical protein